VSPETRQKLKNFWLISLTIETSSDLQNFGQTAGSRRMATARNVTSLRIFQTFALKRCRVRTGLMAARRELNRV